MKLAIVLVCLLAASCELITPRKPQPRLAVFNETEYAAYAQPGTGVIEGQAFLRTRGGDVKLAAGHKVNLNPVTTYSTEWFERLCKRHEDIEDADQRAAAYLRQCVADGEGRFRFEGLPAGEYYLMCRIVWEAFTGRYTEETGGIAYAKVTVHDGKTARAVVTR